MTGGFFAGVGGVLFLAPQIFVLFFFIFLQEDSGYRARIEVRIVRVMENFGLNGQSFIPMIIGFGGNVPGIVAARSIAEEKERLTTILFTPVMSCPARLPFFGLFCAVFFAHPPGLFFFVFFFFGIVSVLTFFFFFTQTSPNK
ncbi:nucleoside recognition domain-containing protein, partial [Staphylococcus hyicus]